MNASGGTWNHGTVDHSLESVTLMSLGGQPGPCRLMQRPGPCLGQGGDWSRVCDSDMRIGNLMQPQALASERQ